MSGDDEKEPTKITVGAPVLRKPNEHFMEAPKSILGGSDYISQNDEFGKTQNSDAINSPGKASLLQNKF